MADANVDGVDEFIRELGLDPTEVSDADYMLLEKSLADYDNIEEEDDDEEYESLAEAVEDLTDGEVELIDADQLVTDLSKALSRVVEDRLAPVHDGVRQVRELTAKLRKNLDALEEQSDGGPYAELARRLAAGDGYDPTRAEVVEVTQDALGRGVGNFTVQEANLMQKAAGTEAWEQYVAQFRELVEDLRKFDAEG